MKAYREEVERIIDKLQKDIDRHNESIRKLEDKIDEKGSDIAILMKVAEGLPRVQPEIKGIETVSVEG